MASVSFVKAQDAKLHYHDLSIPLTMVSTKIYNPSVAIKQDSKYHLHDLAFKPVVLTSNAYLISTMKVQDSKYHLHDIVYQSSKASFKVYGECGSCKHRIENAAKVNGVISANWNENTQLLTIQYNNNVINVDEIQQIEATVGHDTEKYKANTNLYNQLPDCCHYRKSA